MSRWCPAEPGDAAWSPASQPVRRSPSRRGRRRARSATRADRDRRRAHRRRIRQRAVHRHDRVSRRAASPRSAGRSRRPPTRRPSTARGRRFSPAPSTPGSAATPAGVDSAARSPPASPRRRRSRRRPPRLAIRSRRGSWRSRGTARPRRAARPDHVRCATARSRSRSRAMRAPPPAAPARRKPRLALAGLAGDDGTIDPARRRGDRAGAARRRHGDDERRCVGARPAVGSRPARPGHARRPRGRRGRSVGVARRADARSSTSILGGVEVDRAALLRVPGARRGPAAPAAPMTAAASGLAAPSRPRASEPGTPLLRARGRTREERPPRAGRAVASGVRRVRGAAHISRAGARAGRRHGSLDAGRRGAAARRAPAAPYVGERLREALLDDFERGDSVSAVGPPWTGSGNDARHDDHHGPRRQGPARSRAAGLGQDGRGARAVRARRVEARRRRSPGRREPVPRAALRRARRGPLPGRVRHPHGGGRPLPRVLLLGLPALDAGEHPVRVGGPDRPGRARQLDAAAM